MEEKPTRGYKLSISGDLFAETKIQSVWRGWDAPCACPIVVKSVDIASDCHLK